MVESQIVILVVAGSSPVGHPISRLGKSDVLFSKRLRATGDTTADLNEPSGTADQIQV